MHIKKSDPSVKKILQSPPLCYNKPYKKRTETTVYFPPVTIFGGT